MTQLSRTTVRTAARTAVVVAPLAALAVVASPTEATDSFTTVALLAPADIWVDSRTATSVTICASGGVDQGTPEAGVWVFTVEGAGTAGPIRSHHTGFGATYARCASSVTGPAATLVATVTFTGAGVLSDLVGGCALNVVHTAESTNESGACLTGAPA